MFLLIWYPPCTCSAHRVPEKHGRLNNRQATSARGAPVGHNQRLFLGLLLPVGHPSGTTNGCSLGWFCPSGTRRAEQTGVYLDVSGCLSSVSSTLLVGPLEGRKARLQFLAWRASSQASFFRLGGSNAKLEFSSPGSSKATASEALWSQ